MRALLFMIAIAATAGCLRDTEFKCATSADCTGGTCESTGYCSFADTECADGRRYGAYSGSYSNQCVGGGMTGDGGVDGGDGGGGGCPSTFTTLPNAGGHVYKLTATSAQWSTQRDSCMADGGYLAIPDNEQELIAITTAAAAARTWIGINDPNDDETYTTVKGTPATYLPWAPTEPNDPNGQPEECVAALMAMPRIATDRCGLSYPAVCECDP